MSNSKRLKKTKKYEDAAKLRDILLGRGDELMMADIDPFRLSDQSYIDNLTPIQRKRFKSVSFYRDGGVSRVEFNTGLDIVKGLADIGGVRLKSSSEDENKYRSKPLTINTVLPSSSEDEKGDTDDSSEPSDGLESILKNIGREK